MRGKESAGLECIERDTDIFADHTVEFKVLVLVTTAERTKEGIT